MLMNGNACPSSLAAGTRPKITIKRESLNTQMQSYSSGLMPATTVALSALIIIHPTTSFPSLAQALQAAFWARKIPETFWCHQQQQQLWKFGFEKYIQRRKKKWKSIIMMFGREKGEKKKKKRPGLCFAW